jgi:23S rRNA (cytosine1962-C5)-methyltransferase
MSSIEQRPGIHVSPGIRVNGKAAGRISSGHPWVFVSDLVDTGGAAGGDVVRVLDAKGRTLGTAHYSNTSQIALRLFSRRAESIDQAFLTRRMQAAFVLRQQLVQDSEAYRLIHAEGDLLPGLIVDRYAGWLVVQFLDQGMDRMSEQVVAALSVVVSPTGIVARNDVPARAKENLTLESKVLAGELPPRLEFSMNQLRWRADLMSGQKTGVFLDQRENYLAVTRYAHGRALDCFGGTGGFAMHLARVCSSVDLVDSSAASLHTAKENASLNGLLNLQFHDANALDYLPGLVSARRRFETVVVDPPAFTKSRSAREGALRGYKEINLRALRLLDTGGILVSCSCSHHVSEADLLEVIAAAALDTNKQLRILERRTQAQDHPILLTVPETHYLKCLIFQVL